MSDVKTKKNDQSPLDFINAVAHTTRKEDSIYLLELMETVTGKSMRWCMPLEEKHTGLW